MAKGAADVKPTGSKDACQAQEPLLLLQDHSGQSCVVAQGDTLLIFRMNMLCDLTQQTLTTKSSKRKRFLCAQHWPKYQVVPPIPRR